MRGKDGCYGGFQEMGDHGKNFLEAEVERNLAQGG